MNAERWDHWAVVVSGLPNVNDYIGRTNTTRMMALHDDGSGGGDDDDGTATINIIIIIMIIFILVLI
jgi:hypothetical protein